MQKNIGILGCGWLGLPLAELLLQQGYQVSGTTTTAAKMEVLAQKKITPFLLSLEDAELTEINHRFFENEILIVAIPPKRNTSIPYSRQIENLCNWLKNGKTLKVIFISSTSVYKASEKPITEESPLDLENAAELLRAEQLLKASENKWQTTVIRFAGLFGPGRHPGRFLAGKSNLPDASAPVNLIHLTDCIQIILEVLRQEKWNEFFNAAADAHPSREEFYRKAAAAANLPLPEFAPETTPAKLVKLIDNQKIKTALQYKFRYPDHIQALEVN